MTTETRQTFDDWAIVELMGHRRLAGRVQEAQLFGTTMLRLDVHVGAPGNDDEPVATQFYGGQAVYCVTPTTEDVARGLAASNRPTPAARWELAPPAEPEAELDEVPGGRF